MAFLKFLESLRTPVGEGIASAVTLLGEETFFTVLGLIIVWCWSKKWGFRFLLTGLTGTAVNQLLKAIFVVPRPWILDPEFTIVESARAGATGYLPQWTHPVSGYGVRGTGAVGTGMVDYRVLRGCGVAGGPFPDVSGRAYAPGCGRLSGNGTGYRAGASRAVYRGGRFPSGVRPG